MQDKVIFVLNNKVSSKIGKAAEVCLHAFLISKLEMCLHAFVISSRQKCVFRHS
jgi:hypothetical protein